MARPLVIKDKSKEYTLFRVVQIGAGANGSHFFRGLCQMIRTYMDKEKNRSKRTFGVDLTIIDKDEIEAKNLGNQLFENDEIGEYKVVSLAERYGDHYELEVKLVTEYVKELSMLEALFAPIPDLDRKTQVVNVICGLVDNNKTRQLLHSFMESDYLDDLIWIDAGVEGITVLNKQEHEFTEQDWELVHSSGFGGQVVCGLKVKGQIILDPVTVVYPNILEDAATAFPGESCGALIINNPQRCMTNQMAAQIACTYINNLLHTGTIYSHYTNFNAQFGGCKPVFVSEAVIQKYIELTSFK